MSDWRWRVVIVKENLLFLLVLWFFDYVFGVWVFCLGCVVYCLKLFLWFRFVIMVVIFVCVVLFVVVVSIVNSYVVIVIRIIVFYGMLLFICWVFFKIGVVVLVIVCSVVFWIGMILVICVYNWILCGEVYIFGCI